MPKKSKAQSGAKAAQASPMRRTRDEIESIMKKMGELRQAGSTITDALGHLGISYSNYDYWSKKMGIRIPGVGRRRRKGSRGSRKGSTESVLQAMLENRRERAKLENAAKKISELDAGFEALRKRLGH